MCLGIGLSAGAPAEAAPPSSGAWYDRDRDGHGLDLVRLGERVVGTFFTFAADGQPWWYTIDGSWQEDHGVLELLEFRAGPGGSLPPQLVARHPGVEMRAVADAAVCGAGRPRPGASELVDFRFRLDGEELRWCLEPLLPGAGPAEAALNGVWYGGEQDRGWGLVSYFFGSEDDLRGFQSLYLYDADGHPRWAFAAGAVGDGAMQPPFGFAHGYCRSCTPQPLQLHAAGTASLRLVSPRNDVTHNRISLDLQYPRGSGGRFHREDQRLELVAAHAAPPGVRATGEGLVVAATNASGVRPYLGIPYAAAPVGALRWRAPQAAPPRSRALSASDWGPACPQVAVDGFGTDVGPQDEDCLSLNVFVPDPSPDSALPVLFWIHGGGLVAGSSRARAPGGTPFYEGSQLAAQGAVVVSINYRIGPLGFIAIRDLAGEHPDHPAAGNYGILDQILALRWVQDNIAEFGGDPARVTVFGQSAGATSICALLASPLAHDLFHTAIPLSSACPPQLRELEAAAAGREAAYAQGDRLLLGSGCQAAADRIDCLRRYDAQAMIALMNPTIGFGRSGETFGLVRDGHVLTEAPGQAIAAGRIHSVPILVGVTADEVSTLLPAELRGITAAQYQAQLQQGFPMIWPQLLARYPVADHASPWRALVALQSDRQFICPARATGRKLAALGRPAWRYVYTHVLADASAVLGAFHGADLRFVFGNAPAYTAEESRLREDLQRRLLHFAGFGHPNPPGLLPWLEHPAGGDLVLQLAPGPTQLLSDYRAEYCDFWEQYVAF